MKLALVLLVALAGAAAADTPAQEAGQHFQRGVALYNETDYRAALVEFRRAYEIAPNPGVLYNIGQTQFQLQNYAGALQTFERYLAEADANAAHRAEVTQSLDTLRTRVGKIAITAKPAVGEVTIDDELVGKLPLDKPVLVSIGRRKVAVTPPNHIPETRYVEVSAGDTAKVDLVFEDAPAKPEPTPTPLPAGPPAPAPHPTNWTAIGWTTTAILAAGALAAGGLAFKAHRDLEDAKATFPTTQADLDDKSKKLRRFSIAGDALGAAAVIAGAVSLTITLRHHGSDEVHVTATAQAISLGGTFR